MADDLRLWVGLELFRRGVRLIEPRNRSARRLQASRSAKIGAFGMKCAVFCPPRAGPAQGTTPWPTVLANSKATHLERKTPISLAEGAIRLGLSS